LTLPRALLKLERQLNRSQAMSESRLHQAQGYSELLQLLPESLQRFAGWQASRWSGYELDETLRVPPEQARAVLGELLERLDDNYPFFHPSYAGQMLKPPHALAAIAYFLTMELNPNNHALDGGPATARMEMEVMADLASLFGYEQSLGHLTSSGTVANLEALWVARSMHPDKAIAFSEEAHYTHGRMCEVLGAKSVKLRIDARGRPGSGRPPGSPENGPHRHGGRNLRHDGAGCGRSDPRSGRVAARLRISHSRGRRLWRILQTTDRRAGALQAEDAAAFRAIVRCDSVVVDPHKHGLQPYGCGSVIFRDPAVGRFYKHDSPYTYFTSGELHLGEISLECSRAGAAAAALWTTLKCFPLASESGLGAVLLKGRRAALRWAELIQASEELRLLIEPSLDILNFYAVTQGVRVTEINALTQRVFEALMNDRAHPVYLAKLNLKPPLLAAHDDLIWDMEPPDRLSQRLNEAGTLAYRADVA
jgi:glutamate/tyrosine decarboxylase-like PLP-dependent enzyme